MNAEQLQALSDALHEYLTMILDTQEKRKQNLIKRIKNGNIGYLTEDVSEINKHQQQIDGFYQCYAILVQAVDLPMPSRDESEDVSLDTFLIAPESTTCEGCGGAGTVLFFGFESDNLIVTCPICSGKAQS